MNFIIRYAELEDDFFEETGYIHEGHIYDRICIAIDCMYKDTFHKEPPSDKKGSEKLQEIEDFIVSKGKPDDEWSHMHRATYHYKYKVLPNGEIYTGYNTKEKNVHYYEGTYWLQNMHSQIEYFRESPEYIRIEVDYEGSHTVIQLKQRGNKWDPYFQFGCWLNELRKYEKVLPKYKSKMEEQIVLFASYMCNQKKQLTNQIKP